MTAARVLLVDDEAVNRDMLSRRLERRGYSVGMASSGPEALAALEREPWAALLLDVQMPGMSGLEVLQQVRARWSAAELPVIMVTAKDGSEDIVAALDLGANDYVTKPVDFPVAVARLRTQIARKDGRASSAWRSPRATPGPRSGSTACTPRICRACATTSMRT
jgi:DNA-binding response OmpR family regulator